MKQSNPFMKVFVHGLALVVPTAGAIYILQWLILDSENVMKKLILLALPESLYFPGMGIAIFLVGTFLMGLLMYPVVTRLLIHRVDRGLKRIPLFGSVYSPMRDLFDLFGGDMAERLGTPVMFKVPGTEMEMLGFMTRRNNNGLPEGMMPDGHVVIYVQWSSQMGGYCFTVPEDSIRKLDITVEEGMRWALTAGLSAPNTSASHVNSAASIEPIDESVNTQAKDKPQEAKAA